MLSKLKDILFIVVVTPILLYEVECSSCKNITIQKIELINIKMLRWMCKQTHRDMIKDEVILDKVG